MFRMMTLITLLLLFSGCSALPDVEFSEPQCMIITPLKQPVNIDISVSKKDVPLLESWVKEIRAKFDGQNLKTEKSNEMCRKWRESND